MEKSSMQPFKQVELLLEKSVKRYFSAKNRSRKSLNDWGLIYIAFKKFHDKVCMYFDEMEKGLVENGILSQDRKTLFLREIEMKIEAIESETDEELGEDSKVVVFETGRMTKEDFMYLSRKKSK